MATWSCWSRRNWAAPGVVYESVRDGEAVSVFIPDADVADLFEAIRENRWCFRRRDPNPAAGEPTGDHCGMQEGRCAASV